MTSLFQVLLRRRINELTAVYTTDIGVSDINIRVNLEDSRSFSDDPKSSISMIPDDKLPDSDHKHSSLDLKVSEYNDGEASSAPRRQSSFSVSDSHQSRVSPWQLSNALLDGDNAVNSGKVQSSISSHRTSVSSLPSYEATIRRDSADDFNVGEQDSSANNIALSNSNACELSVNGDQNDLRRRHDAALKVIICIFIYLQSCMNLTCQTVFRGWKKS